MMVLFGFILFFVIKQILFAVFSHTLSSLLFCASLIVIIVLTVKTISLKKRTNFLRKEMHHRVKNNIQLVSSLINLQLRHSIDHKVLSELKDSKSRFAALGILNKIIFQTEASHKKININTLANSIVEKSINQNNLEKEGLNKLFTINKIYLKLYLEAVVLTS